MAFDTLKLARRLEASGFTPQQAAGAAEAMAESMAEISGLATKEDISDLRRDLVGVRTDLSRDLVGVRTELGRDLIEVRTELRRDLAEVKAELRRDLAETKADLLKWMFGALAAQTAFLSAIKFFGH